MSIQVALNHRTRVPVRQGGLSSVHRLYSCVPPRIVERRSSATRLTSLPPSTFSTGSSTPTTIIWRALLFPDKTNEFVVEVDLVAELSPFNPFDFFLEPGVEDYPFEYAPELAKDLEPYRSARSGRSSTPGFS